MLGKYVIFLTINHSVTLLDKYFVQFQRLKKSEALQVEAP